MRPHNDFFAAIDLGSNSFHMLLVQRVAGSERVIAKVKRKVRLAAGLDDQRVLSAEAMERGWSCLALFAERLRQVPQAQVRVVATATLRLAINRQQFCDRAEQILGQPIKVITGIEEAELIYHGVAATSDGGGRRLVIDIGGASTELVLGEGHEPVVLNSLEMGCVTYHERYFSDGLLTRQHFDDAIAGVASVLAPVLTDYLDLGWQTVLGASGSVQAVQEVLMAKGLGEVITRERLEGVIDQVVACGHQDKLHLTGLQDERKPVFASGLAILTGLFYKLDIEALSASGGALREGLLARLLDHDVNRNVRRHSCQSLQKRFQMDTEQAEMVRQMTVLLAAKTAALPSQGSSVMLEMLEYAALLYEIGLSIGYPKAQQHSAYILRHTELVGFSRQQQLLLSALVGNFRDAIDLGLLHEQRVCPPGDAQWMLRLLRLAIVLVGRRNERLSDDIDLVVDGRDLVLTLSDALWQHNPLLLAELQQEVQYQRDAGWSLVVENRRR